MKSEKDPPIDKLQAVLANATQTQLCEIILQKAQYDESFCLEMLLHLGLPDLKEALKAVKERVRIAIRKNRHRGYIDYSGCDAICAELSDCLDAARMRYLEKFPEIAFEIALYLLIEGAKLASTADSSSGSLSFCTDTTEALLEDASKAIVATGTAKLQKTCYEKLCKEAWNKAFEGWTDWRYVLLENAALFITSENYQKLEDALIELQRENAQKPYLSRGFQTAEAKVRLRMTEALEGSAAARSFIDAHLDIDEMRWQAVQQDMERGAFQNAERLCLEKINSEDQRSYFHKQKWTHFLFDIYAATGEKTKQIDIAEQLFLHGERQYYEKMKTLYGAEWNAIYPEVRIKYKKILAPLSYMYVLHAEQEWLLLLHEVQEVPSAVFQYGKDLAKYSPEVVYSLYRAEIRKLAATATDRRGYKKVCTAIRELHTAGGIQEAQAQLNELMQTYKRRPAMVDELAILLGKLKK